MALIGLLTLGLGGAAAAEERAPAENGCGGATTLKVWRLFPGDGVARGWAFDRSRSGQPVTVNFYIDAPAESGGVLAGDVKANLVDKSVNLTFKVDGDHDFAFRIPDRWRDGARHVLYAQALAPDGQVCRAAENARAGFALRPSAARAAQVIDGHCLDPQTRCKFTQPNSAAVAAAGWSDGRDYFDEFRCVSPVGYNAIARLNIMPLGSIGPHMQKDSLDYGGEHDGAPIIYFSLEESDKSSNWSLKKAVFSAAEERWRIYSVLDNPGNSGGVSSESGMGRYVVMNDYSLPGWGPSSPIPGRENKIPAVADVSANPNLPSYPLTGAGPLGITAITNTIYPSTGGAGVARSTCIHMNPKLLDYDAAGAPHTLIANLWQNTRSDACPLPPGAPAERLPHPGNYLYRYKGATQGWQLDLTRGLVTDSIHNETRNQFILTPKLLFGTNHTLIAASRDGMVYSFDPDRPNADAKVLADCRRGGVHFSEAAGTANGVFFLVVKEPIDAERRKYGLANDVYPADIYYLFKR